MGEITFYAKKLHNELKRVGINSRLEFSDGHKSVDIYIPEANLIIEVDGKHHIRAKQALTDLKRDTYSLNEGKITIHLSNSLVYEHTAECVNQIKMIVQRRIKEKEELEQSLDKLKREKEKLEIDLKNTSKSDLREKIEDKIRDLSEEYDKESTRLEKWNYVKKKINHYYNFTRVAIHTLTMGLKYLGWLFLVLPLIFWLFKISNTLAIIFLKIFAILIVLRIAIFMTERSLHLKIQRVYYYVDKTQRALSYIAGTLAVMAFSIWIFNVWGKLDVFLLKCFIVAMALKIIISLDSNFDKI